MGQLNLQHAATNINPLVIGSLYLRPHKNRVDEMKNSPSTSFTDEEQIK